MIVTCARCGHVAGAMCPHCGRKDSMLGAQINGDKYCHTFSIGRPTCYEVTSWETTFESSRIIECNPPMTPEEEEMLAEDADMGIGAED